VFPVALLVFVSAIVLAYLCLKLYDEPVRRWLTKKTIGKPLLQDATEPVLVRDMGGSNS
jgi:peptidoglycan/LPS O-acetylase OafA/YrhL